MITDVLPKGLAQAAERILVTCSICCHSLGEAPNRLQGIFNVLSGSFLGGGQADSPSTDFQIQPNTFTASYHEPAESTQGSETQRGKSSSRGGVSLV